MLKSFCAWCDTPIKVKEESDRNKPIVCSQGCRDAETIFRLWMSDEEINRRAHYRYLTKGEE